MQFVVELFLLNFVLFYVIIYIIIVYDIYVSMCLIICSKKIIVKYYVFCCKIFGY